MAEMTIKAAALKEEQLATSHELVGRSVPGQQVRSSVSERVDEKHENADHLRFGVSL